MGTIDQRQEMMRVENEENCTFLEKVNELQQLEKSVLEIPEQRQAEKKPLALSPGKST